MVQEVKTEKNVCRDYARCSADDLRRMMADRQGLAGGGDQKLTEEQMTSVPNAGSVSEWLRYAVTIFAILRKVRRRKE